MTTYPEDDKRIWRQFRRECVRSGIKSEDMKRCSPELKRFFEEFVSSGKEDEGFARLGWHAGKEEVISTHQQRSTFSKRIGQREQHAFQAVTPAVTSNHETTEPAHMNGASVTRKPTEPIEHNGEETPINRKYQAYVESDDESEHAESIGRSCEKGPDKTLEASTPPLDEQHHIEPLHGPASYASEASKASPLEENADFDHKRSSNSDKDCTGDRAPQMPTVSSKRAPPDFVPRSNLYEDWD